MSVEVAQTANEIRQAQAFCLEHKLFITLLSAHLDQDPFDDAAQHIVVHRASDGEVVATTRIVRSQMADHETLLPMHKHCSSTLFDGLSMHSVGEISRFAISKQMRGAEGASGSAVAASRHSAG